MNPRCDYCGWRIDRGANNKRIAELEAELASIYAALYDGRSVTLADGFAAEEVRRMKRELAEARKDSARLNWLEGLVVEVRCPKARGYILGRAPGARPLREYIDAAIDAMPEDRNA